MNDDRAPQSHWRRLLSAVGGRGLRLAALALAALFSGSPAALAQTDAPAARLVETRGSVDVFASQARLWRPARAGLDLLPGDAVRTGEDGRASLLLSDESLIKLARNTTFRLTRVAANAGWLPAALSAAAAGGASRYGLDRGRAWLLNKNRAPDIEIEMPTVTAAVRGTEVHLAVGPDGTSRVAVLEGAVLVSNAFGSVNVLAGEEAVAAPGSAPVKQVLVEPEDAVQWTIYVPDLFTSQSLSLEPGSRAVLQGRLDALAPGDPASALSRARLLRDLGRADEARALFRAVLAARPQSAPARVGLAWALLDRERAEDALRALEGVTPEDPEGAAARALALVGLGRVAEAGQAVAAGLRAAPGDRRLGLLAAWLQVLLGDIAEARERLAAVADPSDAGALELSALVALLRNDKAAAHELAGRAVATFPERPTAWLVHAYVLQAEFDLDAAEDAVRHALANEPDDVTALLALARLRFGKGYTQEALAIVERAGAAGAETADGESLRGYILLALRQDKRADDAFAEAAAHDPGLGEPRLGRALVAMRRGDSAKALEEVSAAVLLTPRRALYRSYWAKFLYEQRRHDAALAVLDIARRLDPNDPTPALYRSMILRDLNRPGEAIAALDEAVALNDNRAVYRSRFLLDRDLATKNIDLSTVYRELNLQQWAIQKATASVRRDPANASGHLFYAGALTDMDDRSYSRNTENLLARLLLPANANAFNTFEEYTTFLERPNFEGQLTLKAGNRDTLGAELLHYGARPSMNLAYQLGYLIDRTSGWRGSNDERNQNIVGFLKWSPTEDDGVMLAASATELDQHDVSAPRFEYDDPGQPDDRLESDLTRLEIGYHHRFRPGSDALFHLQWIDPTIEEDDCFLSFGLTPLCAKGQAEIRLRDRLEQPYLQAQGEWIVDWGEHQFILGSVNYFGGDDFSRVATLEARPGMVVPLPPGFLNVDNDMSRRSHTVFLHDFWQVLDSVGLEAATYVDWYESSDSDQGTKDRIFEVSPRLGLFWEFAPETTLRLAAFHYVLPFLSDRIEPADVAGIPVYRNAEPGSRTSEVAAQLVHDWGRGSAQIGGAYLERDYRFKPATGTRRTFEDRQIELGGAVNLLLGEEVGLSLEYEYRDLKGNKAATDDRFEHFLKGRVKWVHPSGFFLAFDQTYRHIDYDGAGRDNDDIVISDLLAGLEFPNKTGEVRVEMRNLFDQHFNWVTDDFDISGRAGGREAFITLTINF